MEHKPEIRSLKDDLKKSSEKFEFIKEDYQKCDKELKNKTEEVEMLKIELNSLRELKILEESASANDIKCEECQSIVIAKSKAKEHTASSHVPDGTNEESENSRRKSSFQRIAEKEHRAQNNSMEEEYNCNRCCFIGTSSNELRKHIRIKHMINCTECDFYCNNKKDFDTHKLLIHAKNCIRCRTCGETFESKSNLMKHRKVEHIKTVARCQNYMKRECRFLSDDCWWIHDSPVDAEKSSGNIFKCFT